MARGSLHLSMFVQGDHLNHEGDVSEIRITVADNHRVDAHLVEFDWQGKCEWVVVADPVHCSSSMGNLEGEVFVEHHRQVIDAIDVDFETERAVVLVECDLDDYGQAQVVTNGKPRHFDVVLVAIPNVEGVGDWLNFELLGNECAFDPQRNSQDLWMRI
jgi:hypothetical protein